MSVRAAITNLTVRTKILGGFCCVLAILMIVGGVGMMLLQKIGDANAVVGQRALIASIAKDIDLKFTKARLQVARFAVSGDPAIASEGEDVLDLTSEMVEWALKEISDPENLAKMREIAGRLKNYQAAFAHLEALMRERQILLRGTIDPLGAKLFDSFTDLGAAEGRAGNDAAQRLVRDWRLKLMITRLDVNRVLAQHDGGLIAEAEASAAALNTVREGIEPVARTVELKQKLDGIVAMVGQYHDAFHRILEVTGESRQLVDVDMAANASRLSARANAVKQSATDDQEDASDSIRNAIATGRTVNLVMVAAGLALGVAFAVCIGGAIARPILGMTAAMRRLAGGDVDVDIPGIARTDEIGQMAEAMRVFRDNQIAAQHLAAEARRREAAERTMEKMAALGRVAAGVAHEMNNLLQPIIALSEIELDRLPAKGTPDGTPDGTAGGTPEQLDSRENLEMVLESGKQLRGIARKILMFSRDDTPLLTRTDFPAALRQSIAFVGKLLPPGVRVDETTGGDLSGWAAINQVELTEVMTNLAVNAAHAMHDNGCLTIRLRRLCLIDSSDTTLGISDTGLGIAPGEFFLVSITDTGDGMDPATKVRIFDPFFTTKPRGEGTGLGLSAVFGVLRGWKGAITVDSAIGRGTTFTLYIPVSMSP